MLEYQGYLDVLATEDLNGRQIKNLVRTAHALAVSQNVLIQLQHIEIALNAMKKFESDFDNAAIADDGGDDDHVGNRHSELSRSKRRRQN